MGRILTRIYQVFEKERFLGTREALEDELQEETRQRLIKDFNYSTNIAIFFLTYR